MMPDLGKYAGTVLGAYAASIALIVVLVGVTLWQGARVKRALNDVEARSKAVVKLAAVKLAVGAKGSRR